MITTSIAPDNPALLCTSDQIILNVHMTNTGDASIQAGEFQYDAYLPEHITQVNCIHACGSDIDVVTCASDLVSVRVNNLGVGADCLLQIEVEIPCFDAADMEAPVVTYENSGNNNQFIAPPFFIQVVQPMMDIVNFTNADGEFFPNSSDVLELIIGDFSNREFDIIVTSGIIETFSLDIDLEQELDFDIDEITLELYEDGVFLASGIFPLASLEDEIVIEDFIDLTVNGYLTTSDYIRVLETHVYAKNCSEVIGDGTDYTLSWPCCDEQSYKFEEKSRGVDVAAAPNPINISFYSSTDPLLDYCGGSSSDVGYEVSNEAVDDPPFLEGSGGKQIVTVTFPFNPSWFTYTGIVLEHAGGDYSIDSETWFTVDALTNTATLDVSSIPEEDVFEPFTDLYNEDDFHHELEEGDWFRIVFKDVVFQCDSGDITQNANFFGSGHAQIEYRDMCDMVADPQTSQLNEVNVSTFQNNYSPMINLDSELQDLSAVNTSTPIEFSYVTGSNGTSPFDFNFGGLELFDCSTVLYSAEIVMPAMYSINGQVEYIPAPSSGNPSFNFTPTVDTSDPDVSVYTFSDPQFIWQGTFNFDLQLSLNSNDCPYGTGGLNEMTFDVTAQCDDCVDCNVLLASDTLGMGYHCLGPCEPSTAYKNFGTGIESFVFDRASFGYTDETMTEMVDPALNPELALDRSYPCDMIEVSADGEFDGLPADEVFFMIDYEWFSSVHQFFEFVSGEFVINDVNSTDSWTSVIDPIDLEGFEPCAVCTLELHIDDAILTAINSLNVEVEFNAQFRVREFAAWNTAGWAPSFYLDQIRGQFAGRVYTSPDPTLLLSCDSWGQDMRVVKAEERTILGDQILCPQVNQLPNQFRTLCNRPLIVSKAIYGGMGAEEDVFPNEFRPVHMWPQDFNVPMSIDLPAGVEIGSLAGETDPYVQLYRRSVESDFSVWANNPVSISGISGMVVFEGIDTPAGWPVAEHDGTFNMGAFPNTTEYRMRSVLRHDCPVTPAFYPDPLQSNLEYSWVARPYASHLNESDEIVFDDPCAGNELIQSVEVHPEMDFNFSMASTIAEDELILSEPEGTISGLVLYFVPDNAECNGDPHSVEGVWIQNISEGINIESIEVYNQTINAVDFVEIGDYYYIGTLPSNNVVPVTYAQANRKIEINYSISADSCMSDTLKIEYGFTCHNFEDPESTDPSEIVDNTCYSDIWSIPYSFESAAFQMAITDPPNLDGSPCDGFFYNVEINNPHDAVVSSPEYSFTLSELYDLDDFYIEYYPGCNLDTAGIEYPNSQVVVDCSDGLCTYTLDLNEMLSEDGFPPFQSDENPLCIRIRFTGPCDLDNTLQQVTSNLSGANFCGDDISDQIDNDGYFFHLNFLGDSDLSACDDCDTLLLDGCYGINEPLLDGRGRAVAKTDFAGDGLSKFAIASGMQPGLDFHTSEIDPTTNTLEYGLQAGSTDPNIGTDASDDVNNILVLGDRRYVVGVAQNIGGSDILVSCSNSSGTLLWTKTYDFFRSDEGVKILEMEQENRLLVIGHTNLGSAAESNILAMIIDASDGSWINSMSYNLSGSTVRKEFATDAIKLTGSVEEYAIVGYREINGYYGLTEDMLVMKIDGNLNVVGSPRFPGQGQYDERVNTVAQSGNSLFLVGTTNRYTPRCYDIYVVEVSASNLSHLTNFAEEIYIFDLGPTRPNDVTVTGDGDLIIVGDLVDLVAVPQHCEDGRKRGVILKLDVNPDGGVTSDWTQLSPHPSFLESVTMISPNQIVAVGHAEPFGSNDNVAIIYADAETGESCCLDPTAFTKKYYYSVGNGSAARKNHQPKVHTDSIPKYLGELITYCEGGHTERNGIAEIEGGNDTNDGQGLSVFPNPTRNAFVVQLESDYLKSIMVYDMSGRVLIDQSFGSNGVKEQSFFEVQTESLKGGVYLLHVQGMEKTWTTRISILK